jgi:hypothetical protein
LQHFDANTPIDWEEVWSAFDRDGGLIVENFLDPELLGRLQQEVAPMISAKSPGARGTALAALYGPERESRDRCRALIEAEDEARAGITDAEQQPSMPNQ